MQTNNSNKLLKVNEITEKNILSNYNFIMNNIFEKNICWIIQLFPLHYGVFKVLNCRRLESRRTVGFSFSFTSTATFYGYINKCHSPLSLRRTLYTPGTILIDMVS